MPRACSPNAPPVCRHTLDGHTCRKRGDHRCAPRVAHVLSFFRELLVHTKGDYARQPFEPATWQRQRLIEPLFGDVVFDPKRRRYIRRYRELYLNVARKNGKTEILAALMLYMLVADGEQGAEGYGFALDVEQASHVYRVAARMVQLSPVLATRLRVLKNSHRIVDEDTASFYAVVASDDAGLLGANPHAAYIDELLTQRDRNAYDAIRTGMGTRAQPLLMMATTAENAPTSFAASEREWSERVAADPSLEPTRLVVIYRVPEDADWTDERVWKLANPALGDFLDLRVLRDEYRKAVNNPAAERAFRQFRLNQPVNAIGRAIDLGQWDATAGMVDEAALTGRACYAGLDLATTTDLAAYALDFPNADGTHEVIWRCFIPEARVEHLDRRTGGQARLWIRQGYLTATPGNVIDYKAITAALDKDASRYDVREVAYDRWGMAQLQIDLAEAGLELFPMGQGYASMSPPTKELLGLVAAGRYRHGGNPCIRWQASNLITRTDPAGNVKPDKERSADKIDGIVAGIMALDRATRHVAPRRSAYEDEGLVVL